MISSDTCPLCGARASMTGKALGDVAICHKCGHGGVVGPFSINWDLRFAGRISKAQFDELSGGLSDDMHKAVMMYLFTDAPSAYSIERGLGLPRSTVKRAADKMLEKVAEARRLVRLGEKS